MPLSLSAKAALVDRRVELLSQTVSCQISCQQRSRGKAAPQRLARQVPPETRLDAVGTQHDGARAGSRTLGIKRRLTFLARKRQEVSGRATRIRRSDAFVSQSVLAVHRLPRVSCQISCQFEI